MKKIYNKLVRDNIPTIIQNDHKQCKTSILSEEDYIKEVKKKLIEEANEVKDANDKNEVIKELADVLEVVDAIVNHYGITYENIKNIKEKKANKNGKFEKKIFLEYVLEADHE